LCLWPGVPDPIDCPIERDGAPLRTRAHTQEALAIARAEGLPLLALGMSPLYGLADARVPAFTPDADVAHWFGFAYEHM
jgi:hypothetical protein